MSTQVYIWLPTDSNVGHTSALMRSDTCDEKAYVSWWPTGHPLKSEVGNNPTFEDDVQAERRQPDVVVNIDPPNEPQGISWWNSFHQDISSNYNLHKQNCSWAVATALKEAGTDEFFAWHQMLESKNLFSRRRTLSLWDVVFGYPFKVWQLLARKLSFEAAMGRPLVSLADRLTPVWSPTDLLEYLMIARINSVILKEGGRISLPSIKLDLE